VLSITFYDNVKYKRFDFMNRDKDFFGNGLVNTTDFPLTYPTPAGMTVQVGAGTAWVDGYRIANDAPVTLTVQAPDPTNTRVDIIQIGHDDINKQPSLLVKAGVPAQSPIEPGADTNYIKLFSITVAPGTTSIGSSNVLDRRNLVPLNVSASQLQGLQAGISPTDPAYLNVKNGQYVIPGNGLGATAGQNEETLNLLPAKSNALGGVIPGDGLAIANDGTLSVQRNRASASETKITSTSATSLTQYTPAAQGNFLIMVYYRVITATTNVTIQITYTDAGGAQTITVLNIQSTAVGSYSTLPVFINAAAGSPITVQITAGTANQVYASTSIVGV
jgi:hypothetical protein